MKMAGFGTSLRNNTEFRSMQYVTPARITGRKRTWSPSFVSTLSPRRVARPPLRLNGAVQTLLERGLIILIGTPTYALETVVGKLSRKRRYLFGYHQFHTERDVCAQCFSEKIDTFLCQLFNSFHHARTIVSTLRFSFEKGTIGGNNWF